MFTCGWAITEADEAAIATLPADAWKPGIRQDATSSRKYSITCTNIPDAGMPQVPSKSWQVNAGWVIAANIAAAA
jgi:hypothetical protein